MGSQQLLLIVVGVIIVGIAVILGFGMFNSAAEGGNIDNAVAYSQSLARDAASSILRGTTLGGQNSYGDWASAFGDSTIGTFGDVSADYQTPNLEFDWTFNSGGGALVKVNPITGAVSTTPIQ